MAGSVLQTCVGRNEGLNLTCPCLLVFSLSILTAVSATGNDGNWASASLVASLAFSKSHVGASTPLNSVLYGLCTAGSNVSVLVGTDFSFAMSYFQGNMLETVLASMGYHSQQHRYTKPAQIAATH